MDKIAENFIPHPMGVYEDIVRYYSNRSEPLGLPYIEKQYVRRA